MTASAIADSAKFSFRFLRSVACRGCRYRGEYPTLLSFTVSTLNTAKSVTIFYAKAYSTFIQAGTFYFLDVSKDFHSQPLCNPNFCTPSPKTSFYACYDVCRTQ